MIWRWTAGVHCNNKSQVFGEELCGSNKAVWTSKRDILPWTLNVWITITSHNRCLLALSALWEFPIMSVFWIVLCLPVWLMLFYVCVRYIVFASSAPSFLFALHLCPLIWCLDDCVPLLAWLFCVCLCMLYLFVRVWSVQLTAPGLAGHHGRSVRCPVEVGTINERAHAPALPLQMEGTSASACTQRRLFATHKPVMVRSVPIQNHKWDKKIFMWNVLQKKSRLSKLSSTSVCKHKIHMVFNVSSVHQHPLLSPFINIQFLWRLISAME